MNIETISATITDTDTGVAQEITCFVIPNDVEDIADYCMRLSAMIADKE